MPEAAPLPAAALPSGLRDRRILVVEDEYIMAQDLRYELEDAGAEVLGPVPSVTGALTLLAREAPPDAAILDVNLGGEMVYPLADILRQRGIPFMFATGYDLRALPPEYATVPRCEKPFIVQDCLKALFG